MKKKYLFNAATVLAFLCSVVLLLCIGVGRERTAEVSSFARHQTVVIDPGHGGEDGGAVGRRGELEKEVNLNIAKKLELILNLFGVSTEMTRREDISLGENESVVMRHRKMADIKARAELVKKTANPILISIHQNSFPQDISCRGAQVFYSENNVVSKYLAENTQQALKKGVDSANKREAKPAGKSIYVLDNVNCPAILVECGFLTNEDESRLLMTEKYRIKLAACVASGLMSNRDKK